MLVIGGTGGVGEGIVDALIADATFECIVVSSRDRAKLARLQTRAGGSGRLITIEGEVRDLASARDLSERVRRETTLLAVVASLGGWWTGPQLTELDDAGWQAALASLLTPHFVAARAFVPALEAEGSRYLLIGGGAATTPVPGSALVSIAGAAQLMLARALVAERRGRQFPIIEQLIVDGPVKTSARHHGAEREGEVTARDVGEVVASLLRDGTAGAWPNVARVGPIVTMFPRA